MKTEVGPINICLYSLMLVFLMSTCSRKMSNPGEPVQIDAGPFVLTAPVKYKLIKEQGIDSYVGRITNKKIEFFFDYGWYTSKNPQSYYDYVDDNLISRHLEEVKETCSLSDSMLMKLMDNLVILDAKINPDFPDQSDKNISTTIQVGTGNCTISIKPQYSEIATNYEEYHIEEEITYDRRTKLYYPKGEGKYAGIYIEDLVDKRKSPYGYMQLGLRTGDYKAANAEEIISILRTVKLKAD